MEKTFTQNQKVSYDNGVIKGTGKIVGIATNPQTIIGRSYIIEPDISISNETYPYTHFVCFEIHLKEYKKPINSENWDTEKRRDNAHHHNNRLD